MRIRALLLAGLLSMPALADDEVTLKNGDKLTGKVVGMAGGRLVFETPHSGTLKIDWVQIATLKTDGKVKVRLATGEMLDGKLSAGEAGRLKIESEAPAAPVEVDLGKVTHLNEPPTQWHGSVDVAARATDGNTHTKGLLVAIEGTRETEVDKFTLRALWKYAETRGEITERNAYGLGKYQYFFTDQFYAYAGVELFTDKFKDLRLRTVVSAGGGWQVWKSEDWEFAAEAGIAWFDNDFRDGKDESHLGGRLSLRGRVALPLGFEFVDDFTWYPNFDDTADWQIHNEAAIGRSLGGGWTLKIGWILDFDNEPPSGLEEYDNTYFAALGYRF